MKTTITAEKIISEVGSRSKANAFYKRWDVKAALKELGVTKKDAMEKSAWNSMDFYEALAEKLNGNGGIQEKPKSEFQKAAEWASKKFNVPVEEVKEGMVEMSDKATYYNWTHFQTAARFCNDIYNA